MNLGTGSDIGRDHRHITDITHQNLDFKSWVYHTLPLMIIPIY